MIGEGELIAHEGGAGSSAERARFEAALAADAAALGTWHQQRQMDEALRTALGPAKARARLKRAILEVAAGADSAECKRQILQAVAAPGRKRPAVRRLALASLLGLAACAILALWTWLPRANSFASVTMVAGESRVLRHGTEQLLRKGFRVRVADEVRVGDAAGCSATLRCPDGTQLILARGSRVIPGIGLGGGKMIRFARGELAARVSSQPPDAPMTIETPQATATVIGTDFDLATDDVKTRLEVREGLVRLARADGLAVVDVAAGQSAVFMPGILRPPQAEPGGKFGASVVAESGKRRAFLWPFSADSPWNRPLGSDARYERLSPAAFNNGIVLKDPVIGRPVFMEVENFPVRQVMVDGKSALEVRFPDRWPAGFAAPWPVIVLIDPRKERIAELLSADRLPSGDLSAAAVQTGALDGPGVAPGFEGLAAYGGSALGGVIRYGELTRGIPHVLAASIGRNWLNAHGPDGRAFVWPASRAPADAAATYGGSGNLFLGSLLAIPPSVDIGTLGMGESGPGLELARALQDYGVCLTEAGDEPFALFAWYENIPSGFAETVARLLPHLQVVTNNNPQTPGGGGAPRRASAPPLGNAAH